MKVVVGSKNPIKIEVVKQAFASMFPDEAFEFVAHAADSRVSDQPMGEQETRKGAYNRAAGCEAAYPEADYFIGLEGGLIVEDGAMFSVAWMCVRHGDKNSFAHTSRFQIPPLIADKIEAGEELAVATDEVFGSKNSKHKEGTVGILTNNAITRVEYYLPAVQLALMPFVRTDLY